MAYLSVYPGIASCCCDDIYIQLYHIAECACRTVFKFCYGKCSAYAVDGSEVCQHDGDQLCVPYKLRRTVCAVFGSYGKDPQRACRVGAAGRGKSENRTVQDRYSDMPTWSFNMKKFSLTENLTIRILASVIVAIIGVVGACLFYSGAHTAG